MTLVMPLHRAGEIARASAADSYRSSGEIVDADRYGEESARGIARHAGELGTQGDILVASSDLRDVCSKYGHWHFTTTVALLGQQFVNFTKSKKSGAFRVWAGSAWSPRKRWTGSLRTDAWYSLIESSVSFFAGFFSPRSNTV